MPASFDVERFEYVAATADLALVRLAGRWPAERPEALEAPELFVAADGRELTVRPLPGPEDVAPQAAPEPPPWRAAFGVPAELVTADGARFELRAGADVIELPAPAHAVRRAPAPPAAPEPPVVQEQIERRVRERREATRKLEEGLESERHARVEAERQAERDRRARQRFEQDLTVAVAAREGAERQAQQAGEELVRTREELEARMAELAHAREGEDTQLREAHAAQEAARGRAAELEQELLVALAGREELEGRLGAVTQQLEELRGSTTGVADEGLRGELEAARRRASELEHDLLVALAGQEGAPAPVAPEASSEEVAALRAERDDAVRRAEDAAQRVEWLEQEMLGATATLDEAQRDREELARARERIDELTAALRDAERPAEPGDAAEALDRLGQAETARDEAVRRADDMERRAAEAAQRVQALYTELTQLRPRIARAEQLEQRVASAQRDRARVDGLEAALEAARTERDEAVAARAAAEERLAEAESEAGALRERAEAAPVAELEQALHEAESRADQIAIGREEALVRLRRLEPRVSEQEQALVALRERFDEAEARAAREAAARGTLETHLEELATDVDSVRRAREAAERAAAHASEEVELVRAETAAAEQAAREAREDEDEREAAERMAAMHAEAERREEARSRGVSLDALVAGGDGVAAAPRDVRDRSRSERFAGIVVLLIGLAAAALLAAGVVRLLVG